MIQREYPSMFGITIFYEEENIFLTAFIFLIILLIVIYLISFILKRKRRRRVISKNKCTICGHTVNFRSECCKAKLKYLGLTPICKSCKRTCEVICEGCSHDKCLVNCDKCVRRVI